MTFVAVGTLLELEVCFLNSSTMIRIMWVNSASSGQYHMKGSFKFRTKSVLWKSIWIQIGFIIFHICQILLALKI